MSSGVCIKYAGKALQAQVEVYEAAIEDLVF
jgi:hypothetical protein